MGCVKSVLRDCVGPRTEPSDTESSIAPSVPSTTKATSVSPTKLQTTSSTSVLAASSLHLPTNDAAIPATKSVPSDVQPHTERSVTSNPSTGTTTLIPPNAQYTVFISHAGEDKSTIALPLRQMLKSHGITAFVDETDIAKGSDAQNAMITAMETAKVAVVVLSPEFVARKWPMKELMCFLRRHRESVGGVHDPVIIPFFYRLELGELYDEPRLDRLDKNDNPLYHESRFFERMKNREPEANIANIKAALEQLHGLMGVRNDLDASNDSSYFMHQKRELLLQGLCQEVRKAAGKDIKETVDATATGSSAVKDSFHAYYHTTTDISKLVLNFMGLDEKYDTDTREGRLLELVEDRAPDENRVIAVYGIGGVGKTSVLRGLMNLESVRQRFKDGIYFIPLGIDATEQGLIEALISAVECSGGRAASKNIRATSKFQEVISLFRSWFAEKECLFVIDDVWEMGEISTAIIHSLLTLSEPAPASKVLLTTRSVNIASRAGTCFELKPLQPLDSRSRAILVQYSTIKVKSHDYLAISPINDILKTCCGLPLFLAIAGKVVRTLSFRKGCRGVAAYQVYARTLDVDKEKFLDTSVESYQRLSFTLSSSISVLQERFQSLGFNIRLSATQLYTRLSVLERQQKVPMSMLKNLWELGGKDEAAVVARECEQLGLADIEIKKVEGEYRDVLRIHDSLHLFASSEARRNGEEHVAYEALIRGYGAGLPTIEGCRAWWSAELEPDEYIHRHLVRHLLECGRYEEVVELLFHPEWTVRMLTVCGLEEIERDFGVCLSTLGDLVENSTLKALEVLSVAMSVSSKFFPHRVNEMHFQLYGRLKGHMVMFRRIQEYVQRLEAIARGPWLRILNEFMVRPNLATTRIISIARPLTCLAKMNNEGRVVCGDASGKIYIVNMMRSEIESSWKAHGREVSGIAISRNGRQVVSVSLDGGAKVWEVDTCRCLTTFDDHRGGVTCVGLIKEGAQVVTGSTDGTARVWDADTGQVVSKPFAGHEDPIWCLAVLDEGERVLTGGGDGTVRLWNVANSAQVGSAFSHVGVITCVSVFPDRRQVVSGSSTLQKYFLKVWDISTHAQIGKSFEGLKENIGCIAITADGSRIAASSMWGGAIYVWDAESGIQVGDPLEGHEKNVTGMEFLAGDESVVSCSWDGTIRLWDLRSKNVDSVTEHHESGFTCLSFAPDGRYVVSGTQSGIVQVWDATSGAQAGDPIQGQGYISDLAVTHDGQLVWSVSDEEIVRVSDLQSRKLLRTFTSPVGVHTTISCVAVTPNGEHAITDSFHSKVLVWNLRAAEGGPAVLEGHEQHVVRIVVSEDGMRIVSIDLGGTALVWDLDTRRELKRIKLNNMGVLSRREILRLIGEDPNPDDAIISIPLYGRKIIYRQGNEEQVLATLDARVECFDISSDNKTICVGLIDGRLGFLKLET